MSIIRSGTYTITTFQSNMPVGRSPREDTSTRPKPIIFSPDVGSSPTVFRIVVEDGPFARIMARNDPTAAIGGFVCAVPGRDQNTGERWIIRPAGPEVFMITRQDGTAWALDWDSKQIMLAPMILAKDNEDEASANAFPASQAFFIRRV
ncbi:hypothetical protein EIP91_005144 [Steccherinum ochraceum]|uniref:Uncharacterized protein n=1 Tax=Steccherinum ochraceum TaxID=92696 RepID=A0A4R0RMW2_9APHY|nr:hypothetical protein EIP91_005144 [Steccherinum ochraceum]